MQLQWYIFLQFRWIEKHLGKHWCDKIIITKDKTMANGHLLIDDKPNISGIVLLSILYNSGKYITIKVETLKT